MENTTKTNLKNTFDKNKLIVIVLTFTLILIGIVSFFVISQNKTATPINSSVNSLVTGKNFQTYSNYSKEKLAQNTEGVNILFFHASWCPKCRESDENIKKDISKLPQNTQILKVDYDTATELKQKYGVTMQHSFVKVDSNGNKIQSVNGLQNVDQIVDFINLSQPTTSLVEPVSSLKAEDKKTETIQLEKPIFSEYSKEKLAQNTEGVNILFFHASWCPKCRELEKVILNDLAKLPNGTQILKVDYDTATELKQKYGVTMQHTLVTVDSNGNKIQSVNGLRSVDQIIDFIK